MLKKREIDIFGVLLGVVIGCILGFFLSSRIDLSGPINDDEVISQVGNIYLLQIDKLDKPEDAYELQKETKNKDLFTVVVMDNNKYYVYGAIADEEDKLNSYAEMFEDKGYEDVIIKKEYILDKPNVVIEDQDKYDFWTECIDNLINSLEGEQVVINEEYALEPIDVNIYSALLALQTTSNEDLKNDLRLNAYKYIIDALG